MVSPVKTGKSTIISNLLLNEGFYGHEYFDDVFIISNTINNDQTSRFVMFPRPRPQPQAAARPLGPPDLLSVPQMANTNPRPTIAKSSRPRGRKTTPKHVCDFVVRDLRDRASVR